MKYAVDDSCAELRNEYKVLQLFNNLPTLVGNTYNVPNLHSPFYLQKHTQSAATLAVTNNIDYHRDVSQCYFLEQKVIGAKPFHLWFHNLTGSSDSILSSIAQCFNEINNSLLKLHSFGYVHGDISYSNVLVDANNHCFLIDFGGSVNVSQMLNPNRSDIYVTQTYLYAHHGWYEWFYNHHARAHFRKSMQYKIEDQRVLNQRQSTGDPAIAIKRAMNYFPFQYDKYALASLFVQEIGLGFESLDDTKFDSQFEQVVNSLKQWGAGNNNQLPNYGRAAHQTLINILKELEIIYLDAATNIETLANHHSNEAFRKVAATILAYVYI